ncbi:MAG: hypothetical protein IIB57_03090 [Planctomycetes bacterium]|nr:hypothetical protein [Planctomycetota bacterium]
MMAGKFCMVWCVVTFFVFTGGFEATAQPTGVVTVASNATIGRGGQSPSSVPLDFQLEDRTVGVGDEVLTLAGGSATLRFADYGTVVNLWPDSKLLLENSPPRAKHVALGLRLSQGTALLTRKAFGPGLVAIVGGSGQGQGHVLLEEGSVLVSLEGTKVVVEVLQGSARFIDGPLPDAPSDRAGQVLDAGQRMTGGAGGAVERPARAQVDATWQSVQDSTYAYGVTRAEDWVERAERGDFTPVKSAESRAEPELVGTDFVPPQAFDQPTSLAAVTTIQATSVQSLRTVISPVQGLVESGVPGSVIAGQRFRRSIIIGNPGTSGGGPLTINPAAELLIRLAGQ